MAIPAILLAAGASRRLGQPKQLVRVEGEPLLARTLRLMGEAGAQPAIVVLGANSEAVASQIDLRAASPVFNPHWERGIASSIRLGLLTLPQIAPGAAGVILLVCDQPKLTSAHLKTLCASFECAPKPAIVASKYANVAGIPAIFPASFFPQLLDLRGDEGAKRLLRTTVLPVIAVPFPGGDLDLDTPEDLQRLHDAADSVLPGAETSSE